MIAHAPPHPLAWAAPRPLWRGAASPDLAPAILRFASDAFMEQLIALLEQDPARLADHVAREETWRVPFTNPVDLTDRVPLPAPMRQARRATRLAVAAPRPPAAAKPLKLYQPAHQRYYIACATLACAIPGLPDRRLAGGHEQVGMVLRRLLPARPGDKAGAPAEYAFVSDAGGHRWQRVSEGGGDAVLAPGEELLPVFPLAHADRGVRRRVLWGGLIPVARREAYLGASVRHTSQRLVDGQRQALVPPVVPKPGPSTLARSSEFRMDVIEPWKAMIRGALAVVNDIQRDAAGDGPARPSSSSDPGAELMARAREANLRLQTQSWLVLSDLRRVLEDHLPPLVAAIQTNSEAGLTERQKDFFRFLSRDLSSDDQSALRRGFLLKGESDDVRPYSASIAAALRALTPTAREGLEAMTTTYDGGTGGPWPAFHALLAGIGRDVDGKASSLVALGPFRFTTSLGAADKEQILSSPSVELIEPGDPALAIPGLRFDINELERLATLFGRCLTPEVETTARPMPYAQQLALTMAKTIDDPGLFCLRFVHLNADCGPLHPPTLSAPSASFELAAFFDADAPARPLRVTLPLDASPAGLRKHARGTAFVLSDLLCGQVQRAKGLGLIDLIRHVLPWPLHKQLDIGVGGGCKNGRDVDIGMICSLSIPIITICALILLMIIVSLLDFIFRWLPWFVMCFPVPGLKAKGGKP
ncbi:MAG: hypothetical protein ACK41W_13895 [Cyanobacteriota bacterium]